MQAVASFEAAVDGIPVDFRPGRTMVVFSPGFGVRQDAPGMSMSLFRDIAEQLPEGVGYVRFSYCDITDDGSTRVHPVSIEVERLDRVVRWARELGAQAIALVGHSQGCSDIVAAALEPVDSVVLLAPPFSSGRARAHHTSKRGAEIHDGLWTVPRTDGTTCIIPERAFVEDEQLNLEELIVSYAANQQMHIIGAGNDQILGNQAGSPVFKACNILHLTIENASHDFQGNTRQELIETVIQCLCNDLGVGL